MGGNVSFSPALQAPIVLSNPTGALTVEGQFQAGGGNAPVQPNTGVLTLAPAPVQLASGMRVPAAALGLAGGGASAVPGLVTRPVMSAGGILLPGGVPGVVATQSGGLINWLGTLGTMFHVGGDENFHFQAGTGNARCADFINNFNLVINSDVGNQVGAATCVFDLSQCEGSTLGDFSQLLTDLETLVTYLSKLTPPRQLFWKINVTGNVGHAAVPGYMLNNATYGRVGAGPGTSTAAYQGGLVNGPAPVGFPNNGNVATVRYDVAAVTDRMAACLAKVYQTFGNSIFGCCPIYSEFEGIQSLVSEMSDTNITNNLVSASEGGNNAQGALDKFRAAAPSWFMAVSISFVSQANLARMFAAMDRNNIALMIFDFTNEVAVRTGGSAAHIWSAAAWRGGSYGSSGNGAFVPGGTTGLFDRRQLSGTGRVCVAHYSADELGQRPLSGQTFSTAVVPPAHEGDGTIPAMYTQEQLMECALRDVYKNGFTGPKCNSMATWTGQPADYADYAANPWLPDNLVGAWQQNRPIVAPAYPRTYPR